MKKESKAWEIWNYPLICPDVEADAIYVPHQEHNLANKAEDVLSVKHSSKPFVEINMNVDVLISMFSTYKCGQS
jgi:hypothetical protein